MSSGKGHVFIMQISGGKKRKERKRKKKNEGNKMIRIH